MPGDAVEEEARLKSTMRQASVEFGVTVLDALSYINHDLLTVLILIFWAACE